MMLSSRREKDLVKAILTSTIKVSVTSLASTLYDKSYYLLTKMGKGMGQEKNGDKWSNHSKKSRFVSL